MSRIATYNTHRPQSDQPSRWMIATTLFGVNTYQLSHTPLSTSRRAYVHIVLALIIFESFKLWSFMHAGYLQLFRNVIDPCATDIFHNSFQLPLLQGSFCLWVNCEQLWNEFQGVILKNTVHYMRRPTTVTTVNSQMISHFCKLGLHNTQW